MKLLHYTYRKLSLLLFLLMAGWGVLFYYAIVEEVVDETDDTLENYAYLLIREILRDPALLNTHGNLMSAYSCRPITEAEATDYQEVFYDTSIYIEIEDEYEPARAMRTIFRMPDGQFYELTLMISTMERNDLQEAMLWYLSILFFLLLICTSIGIRLTLKSIFRPLQRLIDWLQDIEPGKPVPPLNNPTQIREFRLLSDAAIDMAGRSYKAYEEQKQFIENASHELQTPLAIVRGKVELLAESESLTEQQMKELDAIYTTLNRAVRLNRSLLLLSRIENGQFAEQEDISMDEIIDDSLPDLMDIYNHKHIHLTRKRGDSPFIVRCNHALAQIMLSNLIKNALLHNQNQGKLQIITTSDSLLIKNSGEASLDKEKLFQRFYHAIDGNKDSNGLGLAIAHTIATSASLNLSYEWEDNMHCFRLAKDGKIKSKQA